MFIAIINIAEPLQEKLAPVTLGMLQLCCATVMIMPNQHLTTIPISPIMPHVPVTLTCVPFQLVHHDSYQKPRTLFVK